MPPPHRSAPASPRCDRNRLLLPDLSARRVSQRRAWSVPATSHSVTPPVQTPRFEAELCKAPGPQRTDRVPPLTAALGSAELPQIFARKQLPRHAHKAGGVHTQPHASISAGGGTHTRARLCTYIITHIHVAPGACVSRGTRSRCTGVGVPVETPPAQKGPFLFFSHPPRQGAAQPRGPTPAPAPGTGRAGGDGRRRGGFCRSQEQQQQPRLLSLAMNYA